MTSLRNALLSLSLLSASVSPAIAAAQQSMGKPVLSAAPAPPSAPSTAASTAATTVTPAPVTVDPNYIIGPDDSIDVTVWKEVGLSGTKPVRPDGKITLPLVGDIVAAGFTPMQLATNITSLLKAFVIDPSVSVSVLGVNSKRIYMVGEVGHVGPLAMSPGMTILQAIATAGGLSAYANTKHIYILRNEAGGEKKIFFNYKKAVKSGDLQGITLLPEDTIVVP